MSSPTHTHDFHSISAGNHESSHHSSSTFWLRFRKNFKREFISGLNFIGFVLMIIWISFLGFMMFLYEFPYVKSFLAVVVPPIAVYYVGKNLTLLPMFIVIPLVIATLLYGHKYPRIILSLAVPLSLIIVFLI